MVQLLHLRWLTHNFVKPCQTDNVSVTNSKWRIRWLVFLVKIAYFALSSQTINLLIFRKISQYDFLKMSTNGRVWLMKTFLRLILHRWRGLFYYTAPGSKPAQHPLTESNAMDAFISKKMNWLNNILIKHRRKRFICKYFTCYLTPRHFNETFIFTTLTWVSHSFTTSS